MFNVTIVTGEQYLDLAELPDAEDVYKIDKEITWVDSILDDLEHRLYSIELLRSSLEESTNLVSKKMVGFAIIGLLTIGFVNFLAYREMKKELKKRKLI